MELNWGWPATRPRTRVQHAQNAFLAAYRARKVFCGRLHSRLLVVLEETGAGGAGVFLNLHTKRRSKNVSEKDSRGACAPTASFPSPTQTTARRPPGSTCNRPNRTLLRKAYSQRHVYLTRARQTKTKPRLTGQISSSTRPLARHSSAVSHQSLLAHFARSSSIDSFPPVRFAMNGNSESSSRFMFRLLSSMWDDD